MDSDIFYVECPKCHYEWGIYRPSLSFDNYGQNVIIPCGLPDGSCQTQLRVTKHQSYASKGPRIGPPTTCLLEEVPTDVIYKNIHMRTIVIDQIKQEIQPGQMFNLKESEVNTPEIKNAISKGIIKIISATDALDSFSQNIISTQTAFEQFGIEYNKEIKVMQALDDAKGPVYLIDEDIVLSSTEELGNSRNFNMDFDDFDE